MYTTTLNEIKKHNPCKTGWHELLVHLGKRQADDEPLSFTTILESNGLSDAIWALCVLEDHAPILHFVHDCADHIKDLKNTDAQCAMRFANDVIFARKFGENATYAIERVTIHAAAASGDPDKEREWQTERFKHYFC